MTSLGPLATADLVLAGVALPLLVALLASAALSISPGIALGAGSVPAGGTVGYALFYDPPQPE